MTIKLPYELKHRLEIEAKQSGKSVSALIRESIAAALHRGKVQSL